MNFWKYFLLGVVFVGFQACDEVSKVAPSDKDGDIVWVGNGLRLESSHGILVDVRDADLGTQSVLLTVDHFLPVVRSHHTNESIPVRFEWGASQPKEGPIVQLERLDRKGECKRYQSQEGELVCSDSLEALSIKEGSVPLALADGGILYLDLFNSLHHFSAQKEDRILAGEVGHYFLSSQGDIFYYASLTNQWNALRLTGSSFVPGELEKTTWNQFPHIFKTETGEVVALSFSVESGGALHRIFRKDDYFVTELIQNFEPGWEWIGLGESPNIVKIRNAENAEFWMRLTNEGFEVMELPKKEESQDLSLQTSGEFSVAQVKTEEGLRFQLCRSNPASERAIEENTEADEEPSPLKISKCTYLMRSDEYDFREVLLHYPEGLERPQLIAISERTETAEELTLSKQRLSVFEVFTGEGQDPYLVLQSERALDSEIKYLRSYDLRTPQN